MNVDASCMHPIDSLLIVKEGIVYFGYTKNLDQSVYRFLFLMVM